MYKHQQRQLPLIKDNKPDYKDLHSQVMQNIARKLDLAFKSFYGRVKKGKTPGFPRFKGKGRVHSLYYPQSGFAFTTNNKLKVSKIGSIRIKKHRALNGNIKTLSLNKSPSGKWFACFSVDAGEAPQPIPIERIDEQKKVGIDLGINDFAFLSNGSQIKTIKHFKNLKSKLALAQKRLAKKQRRSKNREKAKAKVITIHEKIANKRNDFLHKESKTLVKAYDLIVHENLMIKNMSRSAKGTVDTPGKMVKQKAGLNRNILDMSWGRFLGMLAYKAEEAGTQVKGVPPNYTSIRCSDCHEVVPKTLKDRQHSCPNCGLDINRDHNAAINILNKYLSTVGTTGSNACGVEAVASTLKQEAPSKVHHAA
jgi:putative transposase